jgi:hypothetical protein
MAGAFKTVATKNINRHIAHKSYAISMASASGSFGPEPDLEVFAYSGKQNLAEYDSANNTLTTNGYNKRDIWNSINTNFYIRVEDRFGELAGYQGHVDQTHSGSLRTLVNPLPTSQVISIPHLMIGDGIKPGSVNIETTLPHDYVDDLNGNMLLDGIKSGNVFYKNGIIVIHTASIITHDCTLNFKNTHVIEEHEYMCNAGKDEFNASSNHSVVSSSGVMQGFVSSSAWNPYVTTIGLYDNDNNLLVVGKLGQPIKKSEKYDTSYVIRFDT